MKKPFENMGWGLVHYNVFGLKLDTTLKTPSEGQGPDNYQLSPHRTSTAVARVGGSALREAATKSSSTRRPTTKRGGGW